MKKSGMVVLALSAVLLSSLASWAQNGIVRFVYDDCGNRIKKSLVFMKTEENGRDVEDGNQCLAFAKDLWESFETNLYPNPTEGWFTVALLGNKEGKLYAVLSTVTGVVIEKCVFNEKEEERLFDLTGKPPGVYLLKLFYGDETRIWKIIKY